MAEHKAQQTRAIPPTDIDHHLRDLKLAFIAEHDAQLAKQAAHKQWSHVDYLSRLMEGEAHVRRDRTTKNRMRMARFPSSRPSSSFAGIGPPR